jgi:hypothetical protein
LTPTAVTVPESRRADEPKGFHHFHQIDISAGRGGGERRPPGAGDRIWIRLFRSATTANRAGVALAPQPNLSVGDDLGERTNQCVTNDDGDPERHPISGHSEPATATTRISEPGTDCHTQADGNPSGNPSPDTHSDAAGQPHPKRHAVTPQGAGVRSV